MTKGKVHNPSMPKVPRFFVQHIKTNSYTFIFLKSKKKIENRRKEKEKRVKRKRWRAFWG